MFCCCFTTLSLYCVELQFINFLTVYIRVKNRQILKIVLPILWNAYRLYGKLYIQVTGYILGYSSYCLPVMLQYMQIMKLDTFPLWNYDKPFNLDNKSAPTTLVAPYQEKNSTERVLHRKHFSFFARKNELSTFNDRYLHCDTNRVLGPKHKI